MLSEFGPSLRITLVTFVLCGLAYPLAVTGIAQAAFPYQANGSLIQGANGPVGSALIGQKFEGPQWFHGRVSGVDWKAQASGASNLGPTNEKLLSRVASGVARVRAENPGVGEVPVDLVTETGSGLDPHITPASAYLQAPRVAQARGLGEAEVRRLIAEHTEGRQWGLLGEPRVNVLTLNLALVNVR